MSQTNLRKFFWNFEAAVNSCLIVVFFRLCTPGVSPPGLEDSCKSFISAANSGRAFRISAKRVSKIRRLPPEKRGSRPFTSLQPEKKILLRKGKVYSPDGVVSISAVGYSPAQLSNACAWALRYAETERRSPVGRINHPYLITRPDNNTQSANNEAASYSADFLENRCRPN